MIPGLVYILSYNCNIQVHIRKKICECSYVFCNKIIMVIVKCDEKLIKTLILAS